MKCALRCVRVREWRPPELVRTLLVPLDGPLHAPQEGGACARALGALLGRGRLRVRGLVEAERDDLSLAQRARLPLQELMEAQPRLVQLTAMPRRVAVIAGISVARARVVGARPWR